MHRLEIQWRVQIACVAAGYAAVLAFAAAMIISRHLAALRNPNDFSGGMAAAGDWMLDLFICGLLLIPTFFLAWITRDREPAFTAFAKTLFAFALTAPLSLVLSLIPAISQRDTILGALAGHRLFLTPIVLTWYAAGRLLARFKPAKRLLSSALLIESLTIVLFVGSFFL
jgi:hypothetical protein